nr:hypothetical protein [uncultured Kingella sp.]
MGAALEIGKPRHHSCFQAAYLHTSRQPENRFIMLKYTHYKDTHHAISKHYCRLIGRGG